MANNFDHTLWLLAHEIYWPRVTDFVNIILKATAELFLKKEEKLSGQMVSL